MSSSFGDNKRKPGAGASAVTEARRLATIAQTWTFPSKGPRVTSGTQVAAVGARNAGVLGLKYAEQNGAVYVPPSSGGGGSVSSNIIVDCSTGTISGNTVNVDFTVPAGTTTLTITLVKVPVGYGDNTTFTFNGLNSNTGGNFTSLTINSNKVPINQDISYDSTIITTTSSVSSDSIIVLTASKTFQGTASLSLERFRTALSVNCSSGTVSGDTETVNFTVPDGTKKLKLILTNVLSRYVNNISFLFTGITTVTGGQFTKLKIGDTVIDSINQTLTNDGTTITTTNDVENNTIIELDADRSFQGAATLYLERTPTTWTAITSPGIQNWKSVASDTTGQYLVACADGGNIWISGDSGATWTEQTGAPLPESDTWLQCVRGSADFIAALGYTGLYITTDGGTTWSLEPTGGTGQLPGNPTCIAITNRGVLYAAYADTIYKWSMDGNWDVVSTVPDTGIRMIVISGSEESITYIADGGALVKTNTTLGDLTKWTRGPSASTSQPYTSIVASSDGNRIVIARYKSGIYISSDRGESYSTAPSPPIGTSPWNAVASSSDGTILVAATGDGSIATSVNSGETWQLTGGGGQWYSAASSADGSKLVAVVFGGYIYTATETLPPSNQALPPESNGQEGTGGPKTT